MKPNNSEKPATLTKAVFYCLLALGYLGLKVVWPVIFSLAVLGIFLQITFVGFGTPQLLMLSMGIFLLSAAFAPYMQDLGDWADKELKKHNS